MVAKQVSTFMMYYVVLAKYIFTSKKLYTCSSYTMDNEGLWNITAPYPKAKPEVEGG